MSIGKGQKSHGARCGEYTGCALAGIWFFVKKTADVQYSFDEAHCRLSFFLSFFLSFLPVTASTMSLRPVDLSMAGARSSFQYRIFSNLIRTQFLVIS